MQPKHHFHTPKLFNTRSTIPILHSIRQPAGRKATLFATEIIQRPNTSPKYRKCSPNIILGGGESEMGVTIGIKQAAARFMSLTTMATC